MNERWPGIEDERNPETERQRKLIELFERGLDDEDAIGYHGTSLESIEYLIRNGHLPGGTFENPPKHEVQPGDFYFFPNKAKFPEHPLASTFHDADTAIDKAAIYAQDIAEEHYLMKKLGLDFSNMKLRNAARWVTEGYTVDSETCYRLLLAQGLSKGNLDRAIKEARGRKGVVLGLGPSMIEQHLPMEGDKGHGDLKIHLPAGLDISFLSGLEPIGQQEWDFFEKLQQELES